MIELVDLLVDGGEAMRGLSDKVAAMRRQEPKANISGLLVVRATARNRLVVRDLASVLQARFPGRSAEWLSTLASATAKMPERDGIAWMRVDGLGLTAVRLRA